jgi:hypothetical protein
VISPDPLKQCVLGIIILLSYEAAARVNGLNQVQTPPLIKKLPTAPQESAEHNAENLTNHGHQTLNPPP